MSKDHLTKWLEENKESVIAQMVEKDPNERLMMALSNGIELEKSKYDNWDDNKHYIHVEISFKNNNAHLYFVRKEKK